MKEIRKRVAGVIAAAVMAVTGVVSGLPVITVNAESASDGVEIVSNEAEKVKLLIGTNKPEIQGDTVASTVQKAQSKYLLGIASQFGVFLEGDFNDGTCDVESRLAVGGGANLADTGIDGGTQNGFEVGNGDFNSKVSLGQYRTKIVRQMRRQIFCQMKQKAQ